MQSGVLWLACSALGLRSSLLLVPIFLLVWLLGLAALGLLGGGLYVGYLWLTGAAVGLVWPAGQTDGRTVKHEQRPGGFRVGGLEHLVISVAIGHRRGPYVCPKTLRVTPRPSQRPTRRRSWPPGWACRSRDRA